MAKFVAVGFVRQSMTAVNFFRDVIASFLITLAITAHYWEITVNCWKLLPITQFNENSRVLRLHWQAKNIKNCFQENSMSHES